MNSNIIQIGPQNEYQINLSQMIGKGTYGKVYECEQTTGSIIKLCAKITEAKKFKKSSKREEQILQILKTHPNNFNLVKVQYAQYFENEENLYVVMEKCDMNLQDMLNKNKIFSQIEIIEFLQQFAIGYQALYDNNIIHRDLKPENILVKNRLDGKPQYKLADFGVGKIYKYNDYILTRTGTPVYSPPEINTLVVYSYEFKIKIMTVGRTNKQVVIAYFALNRFIFSFIITNQKATILFQENKKSISHYSIYLNKIKILQKL